MIEFFLIIGLTLFMGFAATVLFERTRISQVLLLMLFGFLLGPISGIIDAGEDSIIVSISQFIGTLALIVLLFDGGMMLDLFKVIKSISKSISFTLTTFALTLALISTFAIIFMGWSPLEGLLLGSVLGGVSSAIVIAMVDKAGVSDDTKAMLTIESTITDALCIIGAIVFIQVMVSGIGIGDVGNLLLSSFLIAGFIGGVSAFFWITLTNKLGIDQYAYMLTLAMVFIVYSVTEGVHSNGGIAVFLFGLILGNAKNIASKFKVDTESLVSPIVRIFQEEVTFFVRTFFFVFMGLLLSPSYFDPYILLVALAISMVILLARVISEKISLKDIDGKDRQIATSMVPRGLASAVLATLPALYGIELNNFQQIIFMVILITNVMATGGLFFFGGEKPLWPKIRNGLFGEPKKEEKVEEKAKEKKKTKKKKATGKSKKKSK
jgi:cell volume regulation protein A